MPLRLNGSTSGFSQLDAPAIAGDQTFTLPGTGGTIDRLNRAGNILQVVSATYSTSTSSSSSTYADTGLTAAITPTSSSSKIIVVVHQAGCEKRIGNSQNRIGMQLLRNSTSLIVFAVDTGYTNSDTYNVIGTISTMYLDSPATTSATTYKTQFNNPQNGASVVVQGASATSTITLLEVAA